MAKIAVVLAGCGHRDGAEIREAVLALLYLDQQGAEVSIFAPDIEQADVVNHLTGKTVEEKRNVLVEAARIARGDIADLATAKAKDFDGLVLPGGFGAAKNLSNLASKGKDATVNAELQRLLNEFADAGKPIGAICISPAVVALALGERSPTVTIGEDKDTAAVIEAKGGKHRNSPTDQAVNDDTNHIVSCSAYMRGDARLSDVAKGIEQVVSRVLDMVKQRSKHAA